MLWTRFAATLSAAALVGFATCAIAADEEYGRSGPFLALGASYAFQEFHGKASKISDPDDSWGYAIKGGYRFNEWFALELDWEHLVKFKDSAGDSELWDLGVNGKFYPFHGIIQPY